MAEIVLDKVTKRYPDGAQAVSEMNIEIADGEFIILVGPSGCGKSTALNMIAGLEDISGGELRIDGQRANEKSPKDRDIAMVFQSYALYPHMSVRENMAFPLRLAKVDDATVNEKVEEAAQILDLNQHLDRRPANLSGGQRQRVAMGRAIVRSPKAFLMDEPLSNLDAKLRGQMRTSVSKLQKQLAVTTVYVTHDQTEAMTLGDRVVVLRGGHVQQIGSPQFLYEQPANLFVAGFIGSPSMNFVPGTLEDGVLKSVLGTTVLTDRVRRLVEAAGGPREVIAGIRPEHFEDVSLVDEKHREAGATFRSTVDVLESMGAEKYAYFSLDEQLTGSEELAELAADAGSADVPGSGSTIVTRLDAASAAAEGRELEVWFDPERLQLFDPKSGKNLTFDG
ncbi:MULTISPECIES: ABC transporter ATP-binding protein [Prauserella salsuginis group]|uniref:Multiple sugar transport system ATP-binding protein n=2 Tax=Prauserella salsuginis group TaxID=2893672 RepID=A0A839XM85_9PSEU|nr:MULTISPECIES: sn-glycerol-3-phosphate ABC transporter ATP-binding protein UgpC [Prauserella salsuginis group]MBB3661853.1 multiple sugar transport system ATP-binding protein [Prauserella sediminis]MCR3722771.1 multiple sugar transport system ATP-binding protein [Prauserella flava]MCR3737174.1 multiple sugar transport system ATP-binding protein [Prauserella salsuginis]